MLRADPYPTAALFHVSLTLRKNLKRRRPALRAREERLQSRESLGQRGPLAQAVVAEALPVRLGEVLDS